MAKSAQKQDKKDRVAIRRARGRAHPLRRLALLGIASVLAYARFIRPWHSKWGATTDEVLAWMPGDEDIPDPNYHTTRAITIDAPPEDVWPWLVQMGQGRGGMYSYDEMENLIGLNIHSADRVIPELQHLEGGDTIPLRPDGTGYTVARIDPERLLLLRVDDPAFPTTWAWELWAVEGHKTRLVVRWRARYAVLSSLNTGTVRDIKANPLVTLGGLFATLFIDPGQFIMERGMLKGIKERAERLAKARYSAVETGHTLGELEELSTIR